MISRSNSFRRKVKLNRRNKRTNKLSRLITLMKVKKEMIGEERMHSLYYNYQSFKLK